MGVEIRETPVSDDAFEEMKRFVHDYLEASVENEGEGGRMRWYPWHSAEYRFNHILNVTALATRIADAEAADPEVTRVAAMFHDVSKLEADQERHAEAGAAVARQYLESHGEYPDSFVAAVESAVDAHSYDGPLEDVSLETRCLMEADLLDKVGANGTALMILRMGYESRSHMNANEMIGRVLKRGEDALDRVVSDTAETIAYKRLKRVRWFKEWLEAEVSEMAITTERD